MKIRPEHPWASRPMWQKRLHGFFCYSLSAIVAIFFPIEADKAMYSALREQFDDEA